MPVSPAQHHGSAGLRVLVTRPAAQATEWVDGLRRAGLDAQALPLIAIQPPADARPLHAAWASLAGLRLVMFVSPNAVEAFFALRPAQARWPQGLQAASPGPGTSAALRRAGLDAARIIEPAADAPQFDSEALWQRLAPMDWAGAGVLVVRGDGGREWLSERLRGRGARVQPLAAYHRALPVLDTAQRALLDAARGQPARHLWLFSSAQCIDHLRRLDGGADWAGARALATHPRIAGHAAAAGFGTVLQAAPTLPAVTACIQCLAT